MMEQCMSEPSYLLLLGLAVMAVVLWLIWPRRGLLWRWQRTRRASERVLIEDALKHIHDCAYRSQPCTLQSIAGVLGCSGDEAAALLTTMVQHELVALTDGVPQLTARGRDYARHVIRAHRLWESYLAERTGYSPADWHSHSERREHELTVAQTDALAAELGHPRFDPHGDPIPTAQGDLFDHAAGYSLAEAPLDQPLRVVHLEDEPATVYAQLLAEGIHLGMQVVVTKRSAHRLDFWGDGDDHVLAPLLANSISVVPIAQAELATEPSKLLSTLAIGESGAVLRISPRCQGAERRRLLDLGILPGTVIQAEMVSPSGDPMAYRIRGALIGLRKEQADLIQLVDSPLHQSDHSEKLEAERVEVLA
jgi:DtxR family Mn-dependent transcriptional regulator